MSKLSAPRAKPLERQSFVQRFSTRSGRGDPYSEPPNRRSAYVGKTRVSLCPRPTVPRRHRNRRRGAGAGPFGAPPAPDIPLRATRRTSAGSRGSSFALSCRRCRPPARRRRGSAATPQRSHAGGGSQGCRGRWLCAVPARAPAATTALEAALVAHHRGDRAPEGARARERHRLPRLAGHGRRSVRRVRQRDAAFEENSTY